MNEMLSWLGIALMVGLTGVGSVLGTTISGNAMVGALKKNPDPFGLYLTLSALPSSQGLYGFVGYFMSKMAIDRLIAADALTSVAAWSIFACGLALGLVGLYSAYRQSQVCANGIQALASGNNVFGGALVMAIFPELYAILATLVTVLTVLSL